MTKIILNLEFFLQELVDKKFLSEKYTNWILWSPWKGILKVIHIFVIFRIISLIQLLGIIKNFVYLHSNVKKKEKKKEGERKERAPTSYLTFNFFLVYSWTHACGLFLSPQLQLISKLYTPTENLLPFIFFRIEVKKRKRSAIIGREQYTIYCANIYNIGLLVRHKIIRFYSMYFIDNFYQNKNPSFDLYILMIWEGIKKIFS